jgi:hypothetical protein
LNPGCKCKVGAVSQSVSIDQVQNRRHRFIPMNGV